VNPNEKIRVLIVDDSSVMRHLIMSALLRHEDIEVVGTAANGLLALEAIHKSAPDIVTLDVEMPQMDGITALKEIRKTRPYIPVIMFGTLTQRGAKVTIDALTSGASDYVGKPTNVHDLDAAYTVLESELIPKIRSLCAFKNKSTSLSSLRIDKVKPVETSKQSSALTKIKQDFPPLLHRNTERVDAIVIGVSTGGPGALMTLFSGLKTPLKVPVFIVQHMPPKFTELLAKRLSDVCSTQISEAKEGKEAISGEAFIAPGGFHLYLKRSGEKVTMHLNEGPPENSCRPSVDVLFRSAAQVYGKHILSVVLTGMGSDGLKGVQEIVGHGGSVIIQDQETSVVWGMPGAIAAAHLENKILPLEEIADELILMTQIR
jgi:two-component system chemotaxis response regulator CheB